MRTAVGALVVVAALLAAGEGTSASLPRCHTGQLRVIDDGDQGAAGTGILSLGLRNTGSRCRTQGYPGIRFLDRHHRRVTKRQVRGAVTESHEPRRVVLRHGGYAHVIVEAPNAKPGGGRCRSYRYVRLIPPDETDAVTARVRHGPGCVGVIHVSPVVAGRDRFATARR